MFPGRVLVRWMLALSILCSGVGWSAEPPTYAGRPLVEVLESLRARGLNLIYSTAVVDATLVVGAEPQASDPRRILEEVLLPLGLEARDGPGRTTIIVPAAPAAVPAPERLPHYAENIVVTPESHPVVPLEQAGQRTVKGDEIALVPAIGGDASRVVELLPGVAAADNSAAFNVRGNKTRDVSFVLDGLELYEPFHLKSFQSPFSFLNSQIVDQIDVLGGGFTADLGDRHGGFVELSTMQPSQQNRYRLEGGTVNSGVTLASGLGQGSLLASIRAWYPEVVEETMDLGESGVSPRFGDAYLKYTMFVSPTTVVSAHSLLASDHVQFRETGGNERVTAEDRSAHFWMRALRSWAPTVSSETLLSGGRLERERHGVSDPGDESILVSDVRSVSFLGLRNDVAWRISDSRLLRGGFDVRPLSADYRYSTTTAGDGEALHLFPSGVSFGAYMAYRTALSEHLVTEAGLRWDRQTYAGSSEISPRLNASWQISGHSALRFGVGNFYQSQRIYELPVEDGARSFLPAELSRQVELTLEHRFTNALQGRIDAYDRSLSRVHPRYENLFNPIELFPETEPDRVRVAPTSAHLRGLELMLQGDVGRSWHWRTSYAWSHATDEIGGVSVPRSWDQTHAGGFLVAYQWQPGWTVSVSGTAHTGWPTTPVSGELTAAQTIVPVVGPRNSERFAAYARLDLKASRSIPLARGRLRLNLEVLNVTNRRNECCVDEFQFAVGPGDTVQTRPELGYSLGTTPSFSVVWDF